MPGAGSIFDLRASIFGAASAIGDRTNGLVVAGVRHGREANESFTCGSQLRLVESTVYSRRIADRISEITVCISEITVRSVKSLFASMKSLFASVKSLFASVKSLFAQ